jgi:hypothetical protein
MGDEGPGRLKPAAAQSVEEVLQEMGILRDGIKAYHGRTAFHGMDGPKYLLDLGRIVGSLFKGQEIFLDPLEQIFRLGVINL